MVARVASAEAVVVAVAAAIPFFSDRSSRRGCPDAERVAEKPPTDEDRLTAARLAGPG